MSSKVAMFSLHHAGDMQLLHTFIHSNSAAIIGVDVVDVFGTINAKRDAETTPEAQNTQECR